jgi:hypothetical protein
MSEQVTPSEATTQPAAAHPAAAKAAEQKPARRAISDPRDVATVVMARMNLVNTKKDELTMAINGLVDMTQQLTRTYAEQLLAIEQLRRRVKALEGAGAAGASAMASDPPALQ